MSNKVRVLADISGHQMRYRAGEEVDRDAFAAKVGAGWRALCEPAEGPKIERAVKPAGRERRSGR